MLVITYVSSSLVPDFNRKVLRAVKSGASLKRDSSGLPVVDWGLSANSKNPCKTPVKVATTYAYHDVMKEEGYAGQLHIHARCRKCDKCGNAKRSLWAYRAYAEGEKTAGRSWFVTFTFGRGEHWDKLTRSPVSFKGSDILELEVQKRALEANIPIPSVGSPAWSIMASQAARGLVSSAIKRLRKATAKRGRFRFLAVVEKHKSGWPHVHLILYEGATNTLTFNAIRKCWQGFSMGWTSAELVRKGDKAEDGNTEISSAVGAAYITKYLGKDASSVVWASVRFGEGWTARGLLQSVPDGTAKKGVAPPRGGSPNEMGVRGLNTGRSPVRGKGENECNGVFANPCPVKKDTPALDPPSGALPP